MPSRKNLTPPITTEPAGERDSDTCPHLHNYHQMCRGCGEGGPLPPDTRHPESDADWPIPGGLEWAKGADGWCVFGEWHDRRESAWLHDGVGGENGRLHESYPQLAALIRARNIIAQWPCSRCGARDQWTGLSSQGSRAARYRQTR